jgi:hypothetical protein
MHPHLAAASRALGARLNLRLFAGRTSPSRPVAKQDGFLEHKLMRAADGGYVDLVLWASPESAHRAMASAAKSETCSLDFSLMQADSADAGAGVLHYQTLA